MFNVIAPIHAYFQHDVYLRKDAEKAFEKLKKLNIHTDGVKCVDGLDYREIWRLYNKLFEEIVAEETDAQPQIDKWGARGYELPSLFFGDSYDCYPCYLDEDLLRARIREG